MITAHGFLLHSFLSPIADRRINCYGGSLANRMRYPPEVAAAIREAWPRRKPFGMRIIGCDWVDGGITTGEASEALGLERNASPLAKFQHRSRLSAGF